VEIVARCGTNASATDADFHKSNKQLQSALSLKETIMEAITSAAPSSTATTEATLKPGDPGFSFYRPARPAGPVPSTDPTDRRALMALWKYSAEDHRYVLPEPTDPAWAPYIDLSSKDAYLAWVTSWKAAYAALTVAQRERKAAVANASREGKVIPWDDLYNGKGYARTLLALRAAGKVQSWARRNAA